MATDNPSVITISGRLSFPNFLHVQAVKRNVSSKFPKDAADVAPDFNILVEESGKEKLRRHILDVFLPYCVEQEKKGEKRNALDAKAVKKLQAFFEAEDWEDQPPYVPIKAIGAKTLELAPECVASIQVKGSPSKDIELKAVVRGEDELLRPDKEILTYPVIRPLTQTVHQMVAGHYVGATVNLHAYVGNLPGINAYSNVCVYKAPGDSFSGGGVLDEDEMFMD